ncbi:DUF6382 domain-containing protein [Lachnoclostridium sp. An181]|uniref:DUF6382 domain-containing protein n=1 Tax=Lachnoclostridium sp. An181 TaxID=1965575 RepID=UPI000B36757F|nr:DUF6382 domain-containing protein [Lachnoclostridium sp. An181]OUP50320.1 hypothetical protein B5F18_03820 [Lachnoclostridium sp. An181]
METGYTKDVSKAYIVVETRGIYEKEYQMCMMETNQIPGLLPVSSRGVDNNTQFLYEINGKVSMKAVYEKAKMKGEEMQNFIRKFWELQKVWKDYLLDSENVLLEPEFIFMEKGNFYFCYYPMEKQEMKQELLHLFEYFVEKADFTDKESMYLASRFQRAALESNFHFSDLIQLLEQEKEETEEQFMAEKQKEWNLYETRVEEEIPEQEEIAEQETEIYSGKRKKRTLMEKIKKYRNKNWGEWEEFFEE